MLLFNEFVRINVYDYLQYQCMYHFVKDFQEGRGAPIFLLTSQVGGLGLTLTNADRVIVVDPAWNPRCVFNLFCSFGISFM